jgi:hypothetical protein
MSDPIEKLNRLGDALEGAPMPRPASEIRARGDRIRRRKHAVIAGASAAVVAAVAVPVIAITAGGSDKGDQPFTPDPTITDSVPMPPSASLSERNLLTDDQAVYPNGGSDWQEYDTFAGDGQSTASPCQKRSFEGLGAGSVFQRDFEFVVTDTGEVEPTLHFNEVVAEFPSAAEAQAAYDAVRGWYGDCLPPGADSFDPGDFAAVPIDVSGSAEVQLSTYGPVDETIDPFGDEGWFLETGLVLTGDRIAVLTQLVHGQDYNWPDGTPVETMLSDAAAQLALGNEDAPPTDPTQDTDWPTSISANFPLTSGWPEDDGSSEYQLDPPSDDNQAMIPAGELQACGNSVVDQAPEDRLTTRLSYGSEALVRELQLFPSDQEAITYLAHLRAVYGDCATEGSAPTFTTEVNDGAIGEESVVITRASDGIGRVVINAVRVGNAVVVDLTSDEGDGATVIDLATATRENLSDVVGQLYELAAPADPGSDFTDPAGTTAIPAGFPLDLAVGEPPVEDSETTVDGPDVEVAGVRAQTACGSALAMPGADVPDLPNAPEDRLGYSISTIGGYDGRTIETHATVQDAIDRMDQLRAEIQGCDRDNDGDGLSDRLWESFNSDTGYDSMTFGWTYEATEFQGPTAGQLYSVVRVGNAILAIEWGSEGSAQSQVDSAPNQVELAQLIAAEMCIFQEAGC